MHFLPRYHGALHIPADRLLRVGEKGAVHTLVQHGVQQVVVRHVIKGEVCAGVGGKEALQTLAERSVRIEPFGQTDAQTHGERFLVQEDVLAQKGVLAGLALEEPLIHNARLSQPKP